MKRIICFPSPYAHDLPQPCWACPTETGWILSGCQYPTPLYIFKISKLSM